MHRSLLDSDGNEVDDTATQQGYHQPQSKSDHRTSYMETVILICFFHVFRAGDSELLAVAKDTPIQNDQIIKIHRSEQGEHMDKCVTETSAAGKIGNQG